MYSPGADELNQSLRQVQEVLSNPNRCDPAAACTICNGAAHHEPWCVVVNKEMEYAFMLAVDPVTITQGDEIELHSLGVLWHSGTENYA